jgi:ubiquinone/menaquinone biosynthesis C-methylase UbiE
MFFKKRNTKVADYYDQFTESYLETYGYAIQAFRPENTALLYKYLAKSIGLKDGLKVLDAGCGVAGPAVAFAKMFAIQIEGLTISKKQQTIAQKYISENNCNSQIEIKQGDFHHLSKYYNEKFDVIMFLESLGHAQNAKKVINEAAKLLNKDGVIYIKDFFPFEIENKALKKQHDKVIKRINESYTYNVLDLQKTLSNLRSNNLEISFIRKFEFEDCIKARASFEEVNKIDLFEDQKEFRVAEWLEIKFKKPVNPLF